MASITSLLHRLRMVKNQFYHCTVELLVYLLSCVCHFFLMTMLVLVDVGRPSPTVVCVMEYRLYSIPENRRTVKLPVYTGMQ